MVSRVSRDEVLMDVAHTFANRGTCSRLQVGAVFSRDGRILSTGYNGTPAGMPHCIHDEYIWGKDNRNAPKWLLDCIDNSSFSPIMGVKPSIGSRYSYDGKVITMQSPSNKGSVGCNQAEHAERNAIAWAARHGIALEGSEVHVTHMPCLACARTMINAGISKVTYQTPYRLTEGVELLKQGGITVVYRPASP